ncbi:MAG: flagellar export protein FliJ [Candidatus Hydrogenedentota bacterium]|nr:MAG: flagellar export protein FliJ [Candidatus Hydrogenedentota bacterium]
MARFRFRLERVLSVRRHEEDREKLRFAVAVRNLEEARKNLRATREELRRAVEKGAAVAAARPTIEDLVRDYEYRAALLRREERETKAVEEAQERYEEARRYLIEARKKRRLLERLRERRFEEWREEEIRREQEELDEMGVAGFRRLREEEALVG